MAALCGPWSDVHTTMTDTTTDTDSDDSDKESGRRKNAVQNAEELGLDGDDGEEEDS